MKYAPYVIFVTLYSAPGTRGATRCDSGRRELITTTAAESRSHQLHASAALSA